jgi:hypothetical protein
MTQEAMWQVVWTIIGGTSVLALGQIIVKFIIEPWQAFAKLKGEIAQSLTYYRAGIPEGIGIGLAQIDDPAAASKRLREMGSQLRAVQFTIPMYRFWAMFRLLPTVRNLVDGSAGLIGMSNSVYPTKGTNVIDEHKKRVSKALKLDSLAL